MKNLFSSLLFLFISVFTFGNEKIDKEYYEALDKAENEYRVKFSKALLNADKVEISIVKFDGMVEEEDDNPFDGFEDEDKPKTETIKVSAYYKKTTILQKRTLNKKEKTELLGVLSKQISKKETNSGALCHIPIHGIKVFKGNHIILESTFCWKCENFTFSYPNNSVFLGTNKEMETLFKKLIPIPQAEIDRFNNK